MSSSRRFAAVSPEIGANLRRPSRQKFTRPEFFEQFHRAIGTPLVQEVHQTPDAARQFATARLALGRVDIAGIDLDRLQCDAGQVDEVTDLVKESLGRRPHLIEKQHSDIVAAEEIEPSFEMMRIAVGPHDTRMMEFPAQNCREPNPFAAGSDIGSANARPGRAR